MWEHWNCPFLFLYFHFRMKSKNSRGKSCMLRPTQSSRITINKLLNTFFLIKCRLLTLRLLMQSTMMLKIDFSISVDTSFSLVETWFYGEALNRICLVTLSLWMNFNRLESSTRRGRECKHASPVFLRLTLLQLHSLLRFEVSQVQRRKGRKLREYSRKITNLKDIKIPFSIHFEG